MKKTRTWIETYSGLRFNLARPRAKDVCIEDIARGLAMTVRFGGHLASFMSVAQHSDRTRRYLFWAKADQKVQLYGLLHDASEAYGGDVVAPLKALLPTYRKLESGIMKAIFKGLGLPQLLVMNKSELALVKEADQAVLLAERRDLKPDCFYRYYRAHNNISPNVVVPAPEECWNWELAEKNFLNSYHTLVSQI